MLDPLLSHGFRELHAAVAKRGDAAVHRACRVDQNHDVGFAGRGKTARLLAAPQPAAIADANIDRFPRFE